MKNYYNILGISQKATQEEIKKAYRKRSMEVHPDRNFGEQKFEELFKEVQEAYEILSDQRRRSDYDYSINQPNRKSEPKIGYPTIIEFTSSQKNFTNKDKIIFNWRTENADIVELKPFGQVPPTGTNTYRFNHFHQPYITIQLRAFNSELQQISTAQIYLTNKSFKSYHRPYQSNPWFRKFRIIQSIIVFTFLIALVYNLVRNCQQDAQELQNLSDNFNFYQPVV